MKKKYAFVIVGVLAMIGLCIFIGRAIYLYNNPLSEPVVGFQYLQPTKLPNGLAITEKRILVWDKHDFSFMPITPSYITVEMNLRTQDWSYNIQERRYINEPIATALHNYDPMSEGVTCTERVTSENKSYRLCHWIEYGTIGVYEVEYIQDGTFIYARLPTQPIKSLSEGELDTFVDSFVKHSPSGITTFHSVAG